MLPGTSSGCIRMKAKGPVPARPGQDLLYRSHRLVLLPVLVRRYACYLFKDPGEIGQRFKPCFSGYVGIRHIGGGYQILGPFNPFFMNIMQWPFAGIL
jgi:hypothetical protein